MKKADPDFAAGMGLTPKQLKLAMEQRPLRLALHIMKSVQQMGPGTRDEIRSRLDGTQTPASVNRAVLGLARAGCLVDAGSKRRGQVVYGMGRGKFAKFLALRGGQSVRTSVDLDEVERAALAVAMKFVRAWPKATDRGSQEGLVSRLVKNLVPLSSS